jgi:hypothetical protein
MARQRREGNGVRAQGDDMIGCDDALIVQAQAAVQIEAAGQGAEVASRVGGGVGERARHWLAPKWWSGRGGAR